ncbi:MAG TPA: hypothetical protein VH108_07800 [Gaiellaceae bacterium]|nr:hypothetical protein [Gaiellaceae bacterium]
MRFSGWSSLAISACSALIFAAPAGAHLSVNPDTVRAGALVDLVFSVPNAADPNGIDRVTIGGPQGFVLDDGESITGWAQSRSGQSVTWSGGNIPLREFARFTIRGAVPERAGTVLFNVLVGDRTGYSLSYRVGVTTVAHGPRDNGARSLGKAALIVAVIGAGLALAALFVALYVWLRPPPR